MPRGREKELVNLVKFRCREISCHLLVRSDEWNDHCKEKYGFNYARLNKIYIVYNGRIQL